MITIYARPEPTTDGVAIKYLPPSQLAQKRDICLYADPGCSEFLARYPWHYAAKPRKSSRKVTLNCFRYRLEWR